MIWSFFGSGWFVFLLCVVGLFLFFNVIFLFVCFLLIRFVGVFRDFVFRNFGCWDNFLSSLWFCIAFFPVVIVVWFVCKFDEYYVDWLDRESVRLESLNHG